MTDIETKAEQLKREVRNVRGAVEDALDDLEGEVENLKHEAREHEERQPWQSLQMHSPHSCEHQPRTVVNQREVEYFCYVESRSGEGYTYRTIARANQIPVGAIAFRELDKDPIVEQF